MARILPVIHHRNLELTIQNAETAVQCGCPGLFLIEMNGDDPELDEPMVYIKTRWPNLLVGANRLSTHPADAIRRNAELGADMTWTDDCGINSRMMTRRPDKIRDTLAEHPGHAFYGAVAFKYQLPESDPALAARLAAKHGFIVTTSGPATGVPPTPGKLESMRHMIRDIPGAKLAVASGITPENVGGLKPWLDDILVSTGIEARPDVFCPDRLQRLIAAAA